MQHDTSPAAKGGWKNLCYSKGTNCILTIMLFCCATHFHQCYVRRIKRGLVILPTCTVVGGMMRLPFMIACMQLRFGSDLSHLTLLLLIYFRVLAWIDFHQP